MIHSVAFCSSAESLSSLPLSFSMVLYCATCHSSWSVLLSYCIGLHRLFCRIRAFCLFSLLQHPVTMCCCMCCSCSAVSGSGPYLYNGTISSFLLSALTYVILCCSRNSQIMHALFLLVPSSFLRLPALWPRLSWSVPSFPCVLCAARVTLSWIHYCACHFHALWANLAWLIIRYTERECLTVILSVVRCHACCFSHLRRWCVNKAVLPGLEWCSVLDFSVKLVLVACLSSSAFGVQLLA